jgi:hypothetical protein
MKYVLMKYQSPSNAGTTLQIRGKVESFYNSTIFVEQYLIVNK